MLDQIVQEIERQGWSHVLQILSHPELKKTNEFFDSNKTNFVHAQVGSGDKKHRNESVRRDSTFWIDPLIPEEPFNKIFNFLEELRKTLNEKFYLGLQQYECHLSSYPPGAFYGKHVDCFEKKSTRSLSFVFYLHEEWNEGNGGELIIYSKDGAVLKIVKPLPGSFVCFLSEEFPHEVKSGTVERRSFTGWMHTKIIY